MRFSSIIASTFVVYIATVAASSSQAEHSLESHAQTTHLMARGQKAPPLLGGLVSGLLPGGKKKAAIKAAKIKAAKIKAAKIKAARKAKEAKKSKKAQKAEEPRPASPMPAAPLPPAASRLSSIPPATNKAQILH